MTMPAPGVVKKKPAAEAVKPKPAKKPISILGFFGSDPISLDVVADEAAEYARHENLLKKLSRQSIIVAFMALFTILCIPFLQPGYRYFAVTPEQKKFQLVPLDLPNLTNNAVLSWAATGVTEIMTIGFGDFESKLVAQKSRFTQPGWDGFVDAFLGEKIDESFRKHQLVLTTVPYDTPVIVSQGENEKHVYEWHIQIPVIMTYATNNNITRPERSL